jgi:hypothetical protein
VQLERHDEPSRGERARPKLPASLASKTHSTEPLRDADHALPNSPHHSVPIILFSPRPIGRDHRTGQPLAPAKSKQIKPNQAKMSLQAPISPIPIERPSICDMEPVLSLANGSHLWSKSAPNKPDPHSFVIHSFVRPNWTSTHQFPKSHRAAFHLWSKSGQIQPALKVEN